MSDVFELPAGLWKDGTAVKEVRLNELNARIRKEMGKPNLRNNPVQLVSTVLAHCIESIGGNPITEKDINNLLIGDRDFCLLKVREISLGSEVHLTFNCPMCQVSNRSSIDLQSIAIYELNEDNYEIREDITPDPRVFMIKGDFQPPWEALFRFPLNSDQRAVMRGSVINPLQAQQDLFGRCLIEWNKEKVFPTHIDDLSLPEINYLTSEIQDALPGPDLNTEIECVSCGATVPMPMESSDFLFPEDLGRRSGKRLKKRLMKRSG